MLNRQTRDTRIPDHRGSGHGSSTSRSTSIDAPRYGSPLQSGSDTTYFNARTNSSTVNLTGGDDVSESSGSESISSMFLKRSSSAKRKPKDSPVQSFADLTNDLRSHSNANVERSTTGTPQGPRFVGTPDYLAPEIILGYGGGDKVLDWVRQEYPRLIIRLILLVLAVGSRRHLVRVLVWSSPIPCGHSGTSI